MYYKIDDIKISDKELALISDIGLREIPTATDFVKSTAKKYCVSSSGVWYILKRLKGKRVVDFTERKRGLSKPLSLTGYGKTIARKKVDIVFSIKHKM